MDFFPPGVLDARPDLHTFRSEWYVRHLVAMQEQPLYPPSDGSLCCYRLLYLPTFRHPVVVRLAPTETAWRATCKRTNGFGGYDAGQLAIESEHSLTKAETQRFSRLLDDSGFWVLPTAEVSAGLDGTQVILEGVRNGKYHVVDRWSPRQTAYAELSNCILGLCPTCLNANGKD